MPGKIATREEWTAARRSLLEKEKAQVKSNDALRAERQSLPMVRVSKDYTFTGPNNTTLSLSDLFGPHPQLIVYHFMLGPNDEKPCRGCSLVGDHIPDTRHLRSRNTSMVVVSRAELPKIEMWKKKMGWTFPWYSSNGSDFNYDFHASLDDDIAPVEYNYKNDEELTALTGGEKLRGEMPGTSVFYKKDGEIYHTYSTYSRGGEKMIGTLMWLDLTPLGRQDGPSGPGSYKYNFEFEEEE